MERLRNRTIQYAQKWLKISPKNAIKLTKIVHIAQKRADRIRILKTNIERRAKSMVKVITLPFNEWQRLKMISIILRKI